MRRAAAALLLGAMAPGAAPAPPPSRLVVIDTDVGDDVDDAFALAWALRAPRLDVRAVVGAFGDTGARVALLRRMLRSMGRSDIAVGQGVATPPATRFTLARAAAAEPRAPAPDGVALMLDLIRRHPGAVTLVALAPLTDVRAMMGRDPATFRRLRAVFVMGGSLARGYDKDGRPNPAPEPEWNAARDPEGLRLLLASGVPVTLFPLDATQVRPDAAALARLTDPGHPATAMLAELVAEWRAGNPWHQSVPTLFDAVPVAALLHPELCPTVPVRIVVDANGLTRRVPGPPNARACLASDGAGIVARLAAAMADPQHPSSPRP